LGISKKQKIWRKGEKKSSPCWEEKEGASSFLSEVKRPLFEPKEKVGNGRRKRELPQQKKVERSKRNSEGGSYRGGLKKERNRQSHGKSRGVGKNLFHGKKRTEKEKFCL